MFIQTKVAKSQTVDVPAGWPIECRETDTDGLVPGYDLVLTPEQLDALRSELQSQYDALQAAKPVPKPRQITPTEFLARLPVERAADLVAAVNATPGGQLWITRLAAAQLIELDSPVTVGALNSLKTAGVLTQQDVDTLLA